MGNSHYCGTGKAYELYAVDALLDLANYGHDAHVLARYACFVCAFRYCKDLIIAGGGRRSLRRDDLTYSTFGHFVGCLMAQARHTDGRVGAGDCSSFALYSHVFTDFFCFFVF